MAAVVHLYISKANEIHTTHQKICSDSSNAKCSSFHFYGSIACGSTYQHSRTDIVIQLINERHGTNKVSKSYTKYENSTCRVAYQLYWEEQPYVTKPIRCYRCQRFGHVAAACLAKGERCSMCSGPHRTQQCLTKMQKSETINLKCANCGEPHSANSNKCPVLHNKMHKKMTRVTTNLRITSMKHATPPPLVTSAEFPAIPTINNSNKVISESLSKTGSSYASVAHIPRPVAMAARTATKAVTFKAALSSSGVQQNIKSKSVENQYPKESCQDASIVEQPIKQGNRKRSAEQSMKSSTPVTDSMTSELASMQPLSTAETYDKIFTVLMTQMNS